MANITTSGVLPAPVQQSFNMKLLAVPTPNMIHKIPAQKDRMPRNGGNTMRYRRYNPLNTSLVPLGTSGLTPPAQLLTAVDIDAQISWYGTWVEVNEQVVLQNQEQVLNEAALRLGVALRQTEDELTRNMLASTASQINCVNGANGDNPTEITAADVDVVTRTLLGNNAAMFLSGIEGEDRFGTAPVRNAYFALCNTDLTSDLSNIPTFIYQTQYPNQQRVLESEWGSVGNMRFLVSSIGSTSPAASANAATVYNVFCVAKESYASIDQDGASAQFIYRPAQYSGPLAQNVTIGYKFAEVPQILNNAWVLNLRCTLS
jgi:N4-gp56 family major capsid protein